MKTIILAIILIASQMVYGQEVSANQERANLWLYVTEASMGDFPLNTIDVAASPSFDVDRGSLRENTGKVC